MTRITLNGVNRSSLLKVLAVVMLTAAGTSAATQNRDQSTIERAQAAVRERIWSDMGVNNVDVTFPEWNQAETYFISNAQTGVRGRGTLARRNDYTNARTFTYEAVVNRRNGRVTSVDYRFNGGSVGGGNETSSVPDWLVGSFRGRNPASRQRVTVTFNRNGQVRAIYDNGTRDRGQYANGQLSFGNSLFWTVTRSGRDIRVKDTASGRTERFSRTSDTSGESDDDFDGVPRWMIGTFRANTANGESELSIRSDGTATSRNIRENRPSRGRYDNDVLTFDWGSYEVVRDGNGIRTIQIGNRNNQTSYRRGN